MISKIENIEAVISKTIGRNIQRLREDERLSRMQLSKMLGVSYQQLYKYERGQNKVSAELIVYLKFYLSVNDYNEFYKGLF